MEEFIFDDEMNDVGADIEAHCPKCHSTSHTIVSKYEDEVRRVQCNSCGHVHPYKKPRDEDEEQPVAPVKKKAQKQKPNWEQMMAKSKKPPRAYNVGEYFKDLEVVQHPKFGIGYVTENIGNDKIEVTFQADKRVLIHNRKGLNLPVAVMAPVAPAMAVGGKKGKKAEPPKSAAPAPAPASAKKGTPAPAPAKKAAPAPAPKKAAPVAKKAAAAPAKKAAPPPKKPAPAKKAAPASKKAAPAPKKAAKPAAKKPAGKKKR